MNIPDSDLEQSRAFLAPTLEATAAILPLLARPPHPPRFPHKEAEIWRSCWIALQSAWLDRHGRGFAAIRPAVFALCGAALALKDNDCLALGEALASATDRLDEPEGLANPRLATAITATIECFSDHGSLENAAFPERARHFSARLGRIAAERRAPARSPVLDRLFAEEGRECLERMRAATGALPPDAFALKRAASDLARVAEALDLGEIALVSGRLVRRLTLRAGEGVDLEAPESREPVLALIAELDALVSCL